MLQLYQKVSSPSRGLTIRQKDWGAEAMSCGEKSSGQIVGYFRHKRTLFEEDPGVPDREKKKLSDYAQSYRKKRSATHYPSPKDLELWCIAIRTDESNFNEPFSGSGTQGSSSERLLLCLK